MLRPLPGQGLPLGQARVDTHAALLMFSLYAHLRSCVQAGLDAGAHVKTCVCGQCNLGAARRRSKHSRARRLSFAYRMHKYAVRAAGESTARSPCLIRVVLHLLK